MGEDLGGSCDGSHGRMGRGGQTEAWNPSTGFEGIKRGG